EARSSAALVRRRDASGSVAVLAGRRVGVASIYFERGLRLYSALLRIRSLTRSRRGGCAEPAAAGTVRLRRLAQSRPAARPGAALADLGWCAAFDLPGACCPLGRVPPICPRQAKELGDLMTHVRLLLVALAGFVLLASQALADCTPIDHCLSAVTCTTPEDSQCASCAPGYYLSENGTADQCVPCTPVIGCTTPLTCTTASNSLCNACAPGRFLTTGVPSSCPACTPVAGCISPLTCTTPSNSQCVSCASGRYLSAAGTSCPLCAPVDH